MQLEKITKIRRFLSKWISPLFIITVFLIVGILIAFKVSNKTFYYFNNRADVVLSDSMSYKNPEYSDFLKGHDNQIQRNDFVISTRIDEATPLDVYDIVLFNSKDFGTNMHRIVDIKYEGKRCGLNYLEKEYNQELETDLMYFTRSLSEIRFKDTIVFSDFEAVSYSTKEFNADEYYFMVNNSKMTLDVTSVKVSDTYYKNTIRFHNPNVAPSIFAMTKRSYDYDSKFSYLKLYNSEAEYLFEPSMLDGEKEQTYLFHPVALYQIRGDASNTADGWFYREQLFSKVHTVIPKIGLFIHFITSPWGIAMIIGLALLPTLYSFLSKKRVK